jgi:hypothetical protein
MNIYLVERTDTYSYDDYDAFVCVAPSAKVAVRIHPYSDDAVWSETDRAWKDERGHGYGNSGWTTIDKLKATHLGRAAVSQKKGVVLASFNAG